MPAELARDQLGEPGVNRSTASQRVLRAGDGWDVTVAVNTGWLAGKAFPVVLDSSPVFVAASPRWDQPSAPLPYVSVC